jgi:uncharacterized Zn finger protein
MLEAITLQDIMTLGGSFGAVVLILAWKFSDEIKILLTSRGSERKQILEKVEAMSNALEAHVLEEKGYWETQEARVKAVEEKNHELEIRLAELAATAKANHEAVVSKLSELTSAVMESLRGKN